MTHTPVELVPRGDDTLEVRVRVDLNAAPVASMRPRHEPAALAALHARERQLNAALDDLSERLGRAQSELNDRAQAYAQLEKSSTLRQLELEERCCLLLESQRELVEALDLAEADLRAARAANGNPPAPHIFSAARTESEAVLPPPPATQSLAGPPEVDLAPVVQEVPVPLRHPIELLDQPAVEMSSPRSTWTRHPTVDFGHDDIPGSGVSRLMHRIQLFVGLTPRFAHVDAGDITDWDDVPDGWDLESSGLDRPWYQRPVAWIALLAVAAAVGLALAAGDMGPRIDRVFNRQAELPSYLE